MRLNLTTRLAAVLLCGALGAGCGSDPSTPEAKRAKAEELLKAMSASLAAAKSLTVDTTEVRDRVRGGQKVQQDSQRQIAVQRPASAYFKATGAEKENEAFYDGKTLTFVWHKDKAWARGPMPETLDKALDFMATESDVNMVSADLFYSNPYEIFEASDSQGGWVGKETIGGAVCHHLAFQSGVVDYDVWVADTPQALPCRMKVVYKQQEGAPAAEVTFKNWNLAATVAADRFTAKVDEGYERLYMVRAATAQPEAEASADQPASPADGAAPAPSATPAAAPAAPKN